MPGGRPTKYKPEHCEMAYKFCLMGATNDQLADLFEVGISSIERWIAEYDEFRGALKKGKEVADAEIANALYHRAKGYSHEDVHVSNYQGDVTLTPLVKHYPPDTAAAFIWLKNRQGWTDKSTQEHTGAGGGPIKYSKLTDEELNDRISELNEESQD